MKSKLTWLAIGAVAIFTIAIVFQSAVVKRNNSAPDTAVVSEKQESNTVTTTYREESGSKRFSDFSPDERAEFEILFQTQLKPALSKWTEAYKGRLPVEVDGLSLTNFHSRLAGGFYTFVIGDITLTFMANAKGTRVFYMMSRAAALRLNSLPMAGVPVDFTVPIKRDEILRMVKADTGLSFNEHQVEIKPAGTSTALNGGVFVEVGKTMMGDFELLTGTNVSFVFSPDGRMVSYQY